MNYNQKQFVYLKVKRFINKQPKIVHHTLPHAVERKINLEDDLKILKDWKFKDFKPRESFIIGETFDIHRKNKIFFTKSQEIFKLVSSDKWRKFSSLRVTEGYLYDLILTTLNYLVKKQSVSKFDLIGFDEESSEENKLKKPTKNADVVRTKITFTYYNRVDKSIMDVLEIDGWNFNLIPPSLTQSQTYVQTIHTSDQLSNMEILNKNDIKCLSATNVLQHLELNKQTTQLPLDSNGNDILHLDVFTNENRENHLKPKVPKSESRFFKIKNTTDGIPDKKLKVADSWPSLDIDLLTEDKFSKNPSNQPLTKKFIVPLNLNFKYNLSDQNKSLDIVENAVCFYSKAKSFNDNCEYQDNINDVSHKHEQTSTCVKDSPDSIAEDSETQRVNFKSFKSNMAARKSSHVAARARSAKCRPVTAVVSGSTALDCSSVQSTHKQQRRPQTAPVAATRGAARRHAERRDARCTAFCSDMRRATSFVRRQEQLNTTSDRSATSLVTSRPDQANPIIGRLNKANSITDRPDKTRSSAVQKLCEAARMRKFKRVLMKRDRLRPDDWKLISDAQITFKPSLNVRYSIDRMRKLTSERDYKLEREHRDAGYYLTQSPSSKTFKEQIPNHDIIEPHLRGTDVSKPTRLNKSSSSKNASLTLKQSDNETQLSDYKKSSLGRSRETKPIKTGDSSVNMFTGDTSGIRGIIGVSLPSPGFVQDILTILDDFVLRVEKVQAQGTKEASRRTVRSITINRTYTNPDLK